MYILKIMIFLNAHLVAHYILSILLSTYACKSLFSIMNLMKSKEENTLIHETSANCVSLKITKYISNIKTLFAKKRLQKSH